VKAAVYPYDLVSLDLNLPGADGRQICRQLRSQERPDGAPAPRVLVVTARDTLDDRVAGLDDGADDYLVKPFALDELLARLRAFERRSDGAVPRRGALTFADVTLDRDAMRCRRGDRTVQLTRTEHLLLEVLLAHPGKVLGRNAMMDAVWGYDFGPDSNSLDVYVGYLRRKLEAGGEPRVIHTVRGVGYVLRDS
ncbi:MAG: response regulator transcription factor, partial [Candidatus Limnocylindria bacterium]